MKSSLYTNENQGLKENVAMQSCVVQFGQLHGKSFLFDVCSVY